MIEQGIVMLVQSDTAVQALCATGGYLCELPKDAALPTWTYRTVSNVSSYGLDTKPGLNMNRVQVDVYGTAASQGEDCLALAKAIDNVLSGYFGILPDPDQTLCQGCFQSDVQDFFQDAPRGYRRMIEYEICFSQQ